MPISVSRFTLESQESLREGLRLLIMSATLDLGPSRRCCAMRRSSRRKGGPQVAPIMCRALRDAPRAADRQVLRTALRSS